MSKNENNKTRLNAVLRALGRPLGVVAGHQGLANWPAAYTQAVERVETFTNAINQAAVTVELYVYQGEPVLEALAFADYQQEEEV